MTDLERDAAQPRADDRTAWLCEMNGVEVNYAKINPDDYDEHWTDKIDEALQFARKVDAENYIKHVGWTHVKATEHMWCQPRSNSVEDGAGRNGSERNPPQKAVIDTEQSGHVLSLASKGI